MKHWQPRRFILLSLVVFPIFLGCTHAGKDKSTVIIATSEAFKKFSGEFENTAYFKKHKPVTLAVLPFLYPKGKSYLIELDAENPGGIVRRGMYNHIASLPFKDTELFDIDKRLKNAGLTDIRKINDVIAKSPRKLKSILGVDAVISGEVTHFDRIFLGIYSQVAVGCEVKMWDLKSGKLLWRAKQVSRAHSGGLSLNPIGIVMSTVASLWNLRKTELLSQTDELFREIVSTIELPKSFRFAQNPPPKIDLFAVINTDKPITAGKKTAFRLIGDPQCLAYVDLGDFKSSIQMTPVSSKVKEALQAEVLEAVKKNYKETGHTLSPALVAAVEQEMSSREIYEGTYTVESGEQAYGLMAKAYLVNSAGSQVAAIDAAHFVDIDGLPPQASSGVAAESLDNKVKIKWNPNPEDDLAHYEIWSSFTPLSGYALIEKSEKNETVIQDLPNFKKVYFQIRAVDRAANAGGFGKHIESVPLPESGLYDLPQPGPALGGEIREKVMLIADKSPYTVQADLRVDANGGIYIEPGTKILFSPDTAIIIAGGDFFAYGTREKPIRLASETHTGEPGVWRGVELESAKRSIIRHVTIEGAVTGLTINNSAPSIVALTVTRCSQAGLYLKDRARPNIICSTFSSNEGQGGIVIEGEGVAPVIRDTVFENNKPFQVQSYTPLQIDLQKNYWGNPEPEADWFLGDIMWKPALEKPPVSCSTR